MRIEFSQEGGLAYLPGLAKPVTIDVGGLPAAEALELKGLVDAAHFFTRPAVLGTPAKGAADYQRYTLTVEDGERRHTVRVLVPIDDPAILGFVRAVKKHVEAARAKVRGKPSH